MFDNDPKNFPEDHEIVQVWTTTHWPSVLGNPAGVLITEGPGPVLMYRDEDTNEVNIRNASGDAYPVHTFPANTVWKRIC